MSLTAAQTEAIARAKDILREHFDGSVIIVRALIENREDGDDDRVEVSYSGGYTAAIGSIEIARHIMKTERAAE